MIFKLISDKEIINPFIREDASVTLIHTFEKALELYYDEVNYLDSKIRENIYWADDIDLFIKDFLKKQKPEFKYKVSLEECYQLDDILFSDEYVYDKDILTFFYPNYSFENQIYQFEILLKSREFFKIEEIFSKLKSYFKKNYWQYIPILKKYLLLLPEKYPQNVFKHIVQTKEYLEQTEKYSEALTGRLFSSKASLQNLAKNERSIVKAKDNCYLLEFDFDAFEFNIYLDLIGLPHLEDPHQDVVDFLNLPKDRVYGKKINYAFIYGMKKESIVKFILEDTGVDVTNILMEFPPFKPHLDIPINNKIIKTYFDRPIKLEKEYAALNNYISGTAADIFCMKFNKIVSILTEKDRIIMQNHDSILIELHETSIKKDLHLKIKDILTQSMKIFTFNVDVNYGKIWGELK